MNHPDPAFATSVRALEHSVPMRNRSIDRVGIKAIRRRVRVKDRSGHVQCAVATCSMYVRLRRDSKAVDMSRVAEELNALERDISIDSFAHFACETVERLEGQSGTIEISFTHSVMKEPGFSGLESPSDYVVSLIGDITDGHCQLTTKVMVPLTGCSKVTVTVRTNQFVWIEEIIDLVEEFATERTDENRKSIEDMVCDIAARLDEHRWIDYYTVESESFESIHNHSTYAIVEGRKASGLRKVWFAPGT
jgi:GTP cyclohydrolase I